MEKIVIDIYGADTQSILQTAKEKIDLMKMKT